MTLLYPEDAWARYGHRRLYVHDARGRLLRNVHACDPLTGEVIALITGAEPVMRLVGGYVLPTGPGPLGLALARFWTRLGVHLPGAEMAVAHWFAPAPLTITSDMWPEDDLQALDPIRILPGQRFRFVTPP